MKIHLKINEKFICLFIDEKFYTVNMVLVKLYNIEMSTNISRQLRVILKQY